MRSSQSIRLASALAASLSHRRLNARAMPGRRFACLGRYVGCLQIMAEAYRVHNADTRVLPPRQPAGPIPGAAPVPQVSDS